MTGTGPIHRLNQYRHYLFLLLILYITIYGWILISTGCMPFVMDNNESFSVLWHSSNLYHFNFWESFGLTDEAFSPDSAAHLRFGGISPSSACYSSRKEGSLSKSSSCLRMTCLLGYGL